MSKLPKVGTTIFTVMSQMANEYGAINLAQGFPNFSIDSKLNDLMKIAPESLVHQYAPMPGSLNLRKAIAKMNVDAYEQYFSPETEILVTAGATQAIFTAIQAIVQHDDEVLQLDPSYDCYEPTVILAGGKSVRVNLDAEFRPDWSKIIEAVNEKTRLFIINNPHNPAGTLWSQEDYKQLVALCNKFPKLLLLSDEVYEFIYFEKKFISLKEIEVLRDRSLIVSSFGKTFHVTGWKVGYIIAPEKWMIELKKVHQFMVFCVHHGAQEALANYAAIADFKEIRNHYQSKRDLFQEAMKGSRFEFLPCEGSFFQMAKYDKISTQKDTDFVQELVKKHGVATIPVSAFYENVPEQHLIRFCFAKDDVTLLKAAKLLCGV